MKRITLGVTETEVEVEDDIADEIETHQSLVASLEKENERLQYRLDKLRTDELDKLRRYETNREIIAAERRAELASELRGQIPAPVTLTALIAEPDEEVSYVLDGLLPAGDRAVTVAPRKTGKTTLIGNLCRSLADQVPFLGSFAAESRTVAVIDVEMSRRQTRRWLADQGIDNTDAVQLIPLRGKAATFNILDAETRAEWAEILSGVDVVVLDCLRPILDALGLSEHTDAGRFLVAFDALLAECGASEAVVVHHAGHGENRARGDSRIEDWPDAIWYLGTEDKKDLAAERTFAAIGRDVDVAKGPLTFDPETRHLTYTAPVGDSSKAAKAVELAERDRAARTALHAYVTSQNRHGIEPLRTEAVDGAAAQAGIGRDAVRRVVTGMLDAGTLTVRTSGRSQYLTAVDPAAAKPVKPENPFGKPSSSQVSALAGICGQETA